MIPAKKTKIKMNIIKESDPYSIQPDTTEFINIDKLKSVTP